MTVFFGGQSLDLAIKTKNLKNVNNQLEAVYRLKRANFSRSAVDGISPGRIIGLKAGLSGIILLIVNEIVAAD